MLKKTPLKRKPYSLKKVSDKQKVKNEEKKIQSEKRRQLFLEIFEERCEIEARTGKKFVRCFETGIRLYEIPFKENTCIYHHCLHKSKYPEYDLCKENLVIITPHIHEQVHLNIDKTPKVKAKTEELLNKHLNNEL